jgi:hypothetical protein
MVDGMVEYVRKVGFQDVARWLRYTAVNSSLI